jgi:CobQ-like glutamine amidotransferase family enzyme
LSEQSPAAARPLTLRLVHLYPDVMNIYGDRGNAIALERRCAARGIVLEVVPVSIGDALDLATVDLVLIGGGQDREQRRIAADLEAKGPALAAAVDEGMPMLAVCGGFQLFGHRYVDHEGGVIPGIGVFDLETRHPGPRADRCIGDVVLATEFGKLVGFENHGGRTYLAPGQEPLGRVIRGFGNNASDGLEGARRNNALGTYLHGSLLPKNPALADHLILVALRRRYGEGVELPPVDDSVESAAHAAAARVAEHRSRSALRGDTFAAGGYSRGDGCRPRARPPGE